MEQKERDRVLFNDMRRRRNWRIPMYAGMVFSGFFALLDPSELVSNQISSLMAVVWALAMVVSAAICLYGSITDKWLGEYTGLPLLGSVVALYGGSAMLSVGTGGFIILGYGLAMVSFSFGLAARWVDVRAIKKYASVGGSSEGGSS